MDIRQHPDIPERIAILTGDGIAAGKWFHFDLNNGGYYTNGEAEAISAWPKLKLKG